MLFLFLGMALGVIILLKIGKKDPTVKEKVEEPTKEKTNSGKEEILEEAKKMVPPNVSFSSEEIKRRQERILSGLSEKERKLFLDFIHEKRETMKPKDDVKTSSNQENPFENLIGNAINIIIILAIGGVIFYFSQ